MTTCWKKAPFKKSNISCWLFFPKSFPLFVNKSDNQITTLHWTSFQWNLNISLAIWKVANQNPTELNPSTQAQMIPLQVENSCEIPTAQQKSRKNQALKGWSHQFQRKCPRLLQISETNIQILYHKIACILPTIPIVPKHLLWIAFLQAFVLFRPLVNISYT